MRKLICNVPDVDQIKTGAHLQSLRLANNYSVYEIAFYAGVSPYAVYKWENGTNLPNISNLTGLQKLYGLKHLEDLLIFTDIAA